MHASSLTTCLVAMVMLSTPLLGATGGFTSTLSAEQQAATGVDTLTDAERDALNSQVAAEVTLARQGDVKGFAGTFTSRRNSEERKAAGLDKLTEDQRVELDRIVASLIAAGPVQPRPLRTLTTEEVSQAHKRFETHGSISYTMGWGSGGRSFQGGSISTILLDKDTGTTFAFTYSQYSGDLIGLYGAGYYCDPVYGSVRGGRELPRLSGRDRH